MFVTITHGYFLIYRHIGYYNFKVVKPSFIESSDAYVYCDSSWKEIVHIEEKRMTKKKEKHKRTHQQKTNYIWNYWEFDSHETVSSGEPSLSVLYLTILPFFFPFLFFLNYKVFSSQILSYKTSAFFLHVRRHTIFKCRTQHLKHAHMFQHV